MPEGPSVFKVASRSMIEAAKWLKSELNWKNADLYIPHQANGNIIRVVANTIDAKIINEFGDIEGFAGPVVYQNIDRYGNMSGVTCGVALDECNRTGIISKGKKVIIPAFGAGLVTAGVALQF
jgi:3-oxoacyl-[acyl-carrier-protein] synthase-3